MGHLGTVLNMSDEVERRVMETNFWGAVALTKAVLPEMIARGSGQIWTVASILGFFGSPKLAAYAASKFAVVGYFESLQYELRNTGVHVGLVSPGFINTNVTLSSLDSEGKPLGKNSIAQEKGMNPEVFAGKFAAKACRKNPRKHLLIGRAEILSVPFKRLFPKLFFMIYGKLTDITRKK
jgi:short-subunit dehydrogenase